MLPTSKGLKEEEFMRMLVLVGLVAGLLMAITGCASVKNITPEQLTPTLAGIPPMPVYFRTPHNKSSEINHLAYFYKAHPALSKYPFLRVEKASDCVEKKYDPTGLLVSVATFPLAVVGHAGWGANAGTVSCKEGSKIETKVRFSVCESLKSETNYEMVCPDDTGPADPCQSFIDLALDNWNKNYQVISLDRDKETEDKILKEFVRRYREYTKK